MAKTPDQQEILNHIWHNLHEKKRHSDEAARVARHHRQQEQPDSEMALELAAMEFVTAGAAARDSKSYKQAHPLFIQAVQVAKETFPLATNQEKARERGNAWEKVYGDQNAQIAMLRNYFHLVRRLEKVISIHQFQTYSHSLWELLLRLSQEFQGDASISMLRIENDEYPQAKQEFEKFLASANQADISSSVDYSRMITISSRMMNRALQEGDYDTTLSSFTAALTALRKNPEKLNHFARQIASNVRVDKDIREKKKLLSWREQARNEDLTPIQKLLELTFFGLGKDRVESID